MPAWCLRDHLSQEGQVYRWRGHWPALGQFLQKLQRKRVQAAHAYTHTPAEVGPGYLLEEDESDCQLPFLLFWITKRSQLFPGLPWGVGGRKDGGREEIPASVAMGESVLKQSILMSYFHFLENTCAIVGGHGYLPRAPGRGKTRGSRAICQGGAPPCSTEPFRAEGRGHPCWQGGFLEWPAPSTKALM